MKKKRILWIIKMCIRDRQTGVMKCEEAADMIYTNLRRQINFKKTMFYCSVIPYIESHQRPSLEHAIIITSSKDIKPFLSKADSCGYSILTDPNEILKNALVLDGWRPVSYTHLDRTNKLDHIICLINHLNADQLPHEFFNIYDPQRECSKAAYPNHAEGWILYDKRISRSPFIICQCL